MGVHTRSHQQRIHQSLGVIAPNLDEELKEGLDDGGAVHVQAGHHLRRDDKPRVDGDSAKAAAQLERDVLVVAVAEPEHEDPEDVLHGAVLYTLPRRSSDRVA